MAYIPPPQVDYLGTDSFLGIHNTSPVRSIPNTSLSAAVDVDIDDAGVIVKRNGYSLAKAAASTTTAYSTLDEVGYIVANGVLTRVGRDLMLWPLTASTATAFTDYGEKLFTNDGLKVQDGVVTDLKVPVPSTAPTMRVAAGSYPAGVYSSVYCYKAPSGLLGAASSVTSLAVADGQAPVVEPPPVVAGYTAVVYMTDADGTVYYNNNGAQLPIFNVNADGFMTGAAAMAIYNSCLYTAHWLPDGASLLRWSYEFHYHLFNSLARYAVVPGEIRALAGLTDGLLIATDAALYALLSDGGATPYVLRKLADYGVPRGRAITRLPDGTARIWTHRGVCEALPFKNLTEKKALFPPGDLCSTALVAQDGIQKFVTVTDGTGTPYNTRF